MARAVSKRRRRPLPLAGRTVVVTGAGSGIGRSLAERLARHGCPVAMIDVEEPPLAEAAERLGGVPVLARTLDVSDAAALADLAAEVTAWAPAPLGAVFNNAGVALASPFADSAAQDEQRVMAVNFGGVVAGTRAFLPALLAQGEGTIVNTSSVFGLMGVRNQSAYCASKFAVRGFTESLRVELAGTGVRACLVHPGGVKTNIMRNATLHSGIERDADREQLVEEFLARARTTPEQAAELIHEGVDRGRARILIGRDARVVDLLSRTMPGRAAGLLEAIARVGRSSG